MTHISLDTILEWEKRESVHTFDVLDKENFDVELKRFGPDERDRGTDHTHDMDELYYVISGSSEVTVGSETYSVREGEMIFVERDVQHEFYDIEDELILLKVLAGPKNQR